MNKLATLFSLARRTVAPKAPASDLPPLQMLDHRQVPVIINSFNRLGSLRRLVGWLLRAGQQKIVIIDNASRYQPLLDYLRWASQCELVYQHVRYELRRRCAGGQRSAQLG